jgi:hypothetical protein
MKKVIFITTIAVFLAGTLFAQSSQTLFLVKLTDKENNHYSLDAPENFLSARALERRLRYEIPLSSTDLPVSDTYVNTLAKAGYQIKNRIKWLNTLIVKGSSKTALEAFPFVASVTPITVGHLSEKPFFQTEKIQKQVYTEKSKYVFFQYDYGPAANQIEMLNGHLVHDAGYRGEGMVIAVLDAGFRKVNEMYVFDSLWQHDQVLGWANMVNDENIFSPTISAHGMHVLSTMGGNAPGEIIGTAPDAGYYLIRTEDATDEYLLEEYYWVDGAEYADSVGADVINSSLGYTNGFNNPANNHTWEDMDGNTTPVTIGADLAAAKGLLVVNSAGNAGNTEWQYIGAPADGDSVLAVGATDSQGNYAIFSSTGPTFDGRVKPEVAAQGYLATVAAEFGGTVSASGTSFSSPIMAGMVASIWQAMPEKSNMQLIELIKSVSSQSMNPDYQLGYGIPDFNALLQIVSIEEPVLITETVTIAPVPFTDHLNIQIPGKFNSVMQVQLFNQNGQKVIEKKASPLTKKILLKDLGHLPSGLYIIKVTSNRHAGTAKAFKK